MTNTIKGFLQTEEASTVKDVATHGVQSGAIGRLIYTSDVVNFYDRYYLDIEETILNMIESQTGEEYYSIENVEAMAQLNEIVNTEVIQFTTYEEMDELLDEKAKDNVIAEIGKLSFDNLDDEEQEELIWEAKDLVDVLPTTQDVTNFVNLAVEIVAQELANI
ncbi:hypothetical protein FMLHJGGC_00083 [Staphylococcus phage BSwM-KMM1]|nr:hypothetical protein FMLHJGGC_00083 [Pseudomonas phage BSwM KMM1]